MVAAQLRQAAQARERAQGQSHRGVPPGQLQGAVPAAGEQPVLRAQPPQAAGPMAQSALRGGGEAARPSARRGRQVPRAPQVPAAPHHLGRRGDQLLFQGEVAHGAARVVRQQPVPEPQGETRAGRGHGADHHAGVQLVQEPQAEGPGGRAEGRVSAANEPIDV